MSAAISLPDSTAASLDRFLHAARPTAAWADRPVSRRTLDELHVLASLCPASAPQAPSTLLFIASEAGRARLLRHTPLRERHRVLLAPVCALIGCDPLFAQHLAAATGPDLDAETVRETARRTAALQGPYLVLAARSLGLEAAPLEGLDLTGLTQEFFGAGRTVARFACALGYPIDEA